MLSPLMTENSAYQVELNGAPLSVHTYFGEDSRYQYQREPVMVSRLDWNKPVEITIRHDANAQPSVHSRVINSLVREPGLIRFQITCPGSVILLSEDLPRLLLCADPAERWPAPKEAHHALEEGVEANSQELQCGAINAAMQRLSAAGGGTLYVPPGVYPIATLFMQSNVTLHLELGACLRATTDVTAYPIDPEGVLYTDLPPSLIPGPRRRVIYWHDCENAALVGRGSVEGQGSELRRLTLPTDDGRPLINLMKFVHARNCRIEGVTLADSEFWNTHVLLSEDMTFDFVKVINERPPKGWATYCKPEGANWFWNNTDGINPDSSQRVEIKHCLFHTGDDCVAVKNTGTYRNELRDINHIHVHDNLFFCGTTAMKIGTETRGGFANNVHFENNTVANCSRVFAAELKDGITVRDLKVENIEVGFCNRPLDLEVIRRQDEAEQKIFSHLDGAVLRNWQIATYQTEGQYWHSHLRGIDSDHQVENVRLENLDFAGKILTSLDDPDVVTNEFISSIDATSGKRSATGHEKGPQL